MIILDSTSLNTFQPLSHTVLACGSTSTGRSTAAKSGAGAGARAGGAGPGSIKHIVEVRAIGRACAVAPRSRGIVQ